MKNIWQSKWTPAVLALIVGLVIGGFLFNRNSSDEVDTHAELSESENKGEVIYTCSMHPQIRSSDPDGTCPICGMALIPLEDLGDSPLVLEMGEEAAKIAGIRTSKVARMDAEREIRLQGKIEPDERRTSQVTARFGGRIEQLFIDFTGASVRKGQKLATIYSPELITAQKELFEAMKIREDQPMLYQAARKKLKLWNLTDAQIDEIEAGDGPQLTLDILSPHSGIVTEKFVTLGQYIREGTPLFTLTDLGSVWAVFDAYESDLPWIKVGNQVKFTVASLPGETFTSRVTFIDPVVNPANRTVEIRTETSNSGGRLKPEMFAEGLLKAASASKKEQLAVPKSAVLWTGPRSVVYVKVPDSPTPMFQFREVSLGLDLGAHYVVESGLEENEEVVTDGAFRVDAAAQLSGKMSMMNRMASPKYVSRPEVPEAFKSKLKAAFDQYIALKNALVASDLKASAAAADKLKTALWQADSAELKEEAKSAWQNSSKMVSDPVSELSEATDLKSARKQFKLVSEAFTQVIETFGLEGVTAYKDYCPMADEDQGAIWLSEFPEIRNPYFGESMLKCGEIKKTYGKEPASSSSHNHE